MNIEQALEQLNIIEDDQYLQNLIAQADARYILLNTSEDKENFPMYTFKDSSLSILALQYLNIGCFLAEGGDFENARLPLEKGAAILEYIHGAVDNRVELSNYYGLVASLSYYISFHYSKSFILISKYTETTYLAKIISLFLKKEYKLLSDKIYELVTDETYTDEFLSKNTEQINFDIKICEIIISKSLNDFVQYFYSGEQEYLDNAKSRLNKLKKIFEIKSDPGVWWIIRLLLLVLDSFDSASVWKVLDKHFDLTDPRVRTYIHSLAFFPSRGIYELFLTQRNSLEKVLNRENNGSIVSIPTSSGKTRIAELAILDTLIQSPGSKVLYVAPYRSLAFEVENSLEKSLSNSGFTISHLYGGGLFSKLDEIMIEESDIIIGTPEKIKAILRANNILLSSIKLIILDEGHLLGNNKRSIINEAFFEELRYFLIENEGKFLLLSAVLPNAEVLSEWLTGSSNNVYKDSWRPSDEKLGVLNWTGKNVNLQWVNNDDERPTFNNGFIRSVVLPKKPKAKKIKYYPADKNEAVAATAYKLKQFGPVLIFVGLKASVFVMANAYLKCLGNSPDNFIWKNRNDWRAFELASIENFGENNNWLLYARKGILCHNADIPNDVRLPLERLMRNEKPMVIISTSTLGQGVNLGISTVIFSTIYQAGELLSTNDFWNIAGRAGRAFIDHEGKVLIAIDSEIISNRDRYVVNQTRLQINKYFDKSQIAPAVSGILQLLKSLKRLAIAKNISFDLILQLITENRLIELGEDGINKDNNLERIDDTLLTLLDVNNINNEEVDYDWIENFFSKSLAYLQSDIIVNGEEVLNLITARVKGIVNRIGDDRNFWRSNIKSGLPLNSSLILEEKLDEIIQKVEEYSLTLQTINDKLELVKFLELIIIELPLVSSEELPFDQVDLDNIKLIWINGYLLSQLEQNEDNFEIINKFYSYLFPWIINGIARKIVNRGLEELGNLLENLSILIEVGLPGLGAVKVYQAGIRSRFAAQELSSVMTDDFWALKSIREIKEELITNINVYTALVSDSTKEWIYLLSIISKASKIEISHIPNFEFKMDNLTSDVLIAKQINGKQFLLSPDLSFMQEVTSSEIDFNSVNNVEGVYFKFNSRINEWIPFIENPFTKII
jgi:hypothetical protein